MMQKVKLNNFTPPTPLFMSLQSEEVTASRWLSRSLWVIGALLCACDEGGPATLSSASNAGVQLPSAGETAGASAAGVSGGATGAGTGGGESAGVTAGATTMRPTREVRLQPAKLARLSRREISSTITQVFGFTPETSLEADTRLHGFTRVANSELSLSPLFTEQLEQLSWEVADHITGAQERLNLLFPCGEWGETGALEGDRKARYESCVQSACLRLAHQVWRRPMSGEELTSFMSLYQQVRTRNLSPVEGRADALGSIIAGLIQSPDFVFRVEVGEPDPDDEMNGATERAGAGLSEPANIVIREPTWRYTNDEMASRLSYLLWGSAPDEALLAAATAGELTERESLRRHVNRLLADPRAATHLASFFDELVGLPDLDAVNKDPSLFPEFSPELSASMRAEVAALFRDVVFERDADVRELLTSDQAELDAPLAALYQVTPPAGLSPGERFTASLPLSQGRGGLLGRAAPLTLFSHATVNSPTFRGRFVRSGLLCQDIPPPPEGVVTELESAEGVEQTLRQRLDQHATDPVCVSCHQLMDPLGYPLESFDPLGRWRDSDNGLPLDTSGDLDGVAVADARELGVAVANSPYYVDCLTRKLYRYSVSHLESEGELALVDALSQHLSASADYRFQALIIELVLSDGFRRLAPPSTSEGETGMPTPPEVNGGIERCNQQDDDQDGEVDEGVVRACEASCDRQGVQRCVEGSWGECEAGVLPQEVCDGEDNDCDGEIDEDVSASAERCDGEDNDCDGAIDEDLSASSHEVSFVDLSAHHPDCQASSSDRSSCNAAIHRFCNSLGCGGSGFGPVELGQWSARVICLPSDQTEIESISYDQLAARHSVCNGQRETVGPNCNAAIHRHCSDQGRRSGFGPIERSPTDAWIACIPSAEIVHTTYTELSSLHGSCHAGGERIGNNCNAAINRLCEQRGHLSGWGPLENSQDNAVVACIR